MVYDALGDTEAFRKSSAKLKERRSNLNAFIKETGRARHTDREQVVGFNRSLSAKTTDAAKKAVQREEYIKKIKPTLPKTARTNNINLQHTVKVESKLVGGVVPKGATAESVRVIAGYGTSSDLRAARNLAQKYGGDDWKWQKKGGIIRTDYFQYDVHWYEYDGKQYESKTKGVKNR